MPGKNTKNHKRLFYIEKIASLTYSQLFSLWALSALLFALGYFLFASIGDIEHHGPAQLVAIEDPIVRFWNSLYFSVITATSVGYGDITPNGFSKALASIQSISALLIFAVFVTKIVTRHQEIALRQVHRMTFEDVFHNIREGLFIMRKDFDHLIAKAQHAQALDDEDWEKLTIAYKQGESLINEIPNFYDQENKLYTLDETREQLLQEALHRTLHRINQTLDALSEANVAWAKHALSLTELKRLVDTVDRVTPLWRERSPYDRREAFEDILHQSKSVVQRIERAL